MDIAGAFYHCLVELDVPTVRRLWRQVAPHLKQPETDEEALATLHRARTQAPNIPLKLRAYSHRWLVDNGLPSGLPDWMKPSAERLYPKTVSAVGISVNARSPEGAPRARRIRAAMETAVLEVYGDSRGEPDPRIVKARMNEARQRQIRQE